VLEEIASALRHAFNVSIETCILEMDIVYE
jgi:hypothetical protein